MWLLRTSLLGASAFHQTLPFLPRIGRPQYLLESRLEVQHFPLHKLCLHIICPLSYYTTLASWGNRGSIDVTQPLKSGVGFMPRGGKKSASQLQNRHGTGNVAPFQKAPRSTSNSNLNGGPEGENESHANGSSASTTQAQAAHTPAEAHLNKTSAGTRASGYAEVPNGNVTNGSIADNANNDYNPPSTPTAQAHHRIDVTAARNLDVHDNRLTNIANTIVQSWPLGDTVAILIFLMSLPSTILTLTNVLFAMLTFVPPSGTFVSLSTALVDIFQGAGGTPSMLTILVADISMVVLWLFLWAPLQEGVTELSQAVVATTLGGSSAMKNRATEHTVVCMGIVGVTHFAQKRWIPIRVFGYDWSVRLASMPKFAPKVAAFGDTAESASRSAGDWLQDLIALHVFAQGMLLIIRRHLSKRNQDTQAVAQQKSLLEAGSPSLLNRDGSALPSPGAHTPPVNGPKTKTSMSSLREAKVGGNRKKRRQAALVRLQQPLWSAIAATKVTVVRELEQSNAIAEATGANAVDTKNLGSASFSAEEGRIWLMHVHPTGFTFGANLCTIQESLEDAPNSCCARTLENSNDLRPCRVLVNGADWISIRFEPVTEESPTPSACGQQWSGEILGLSPSMSYHCVFLCSIDNSVMHIANVITPSMPIAKQDNIPQASIPLQTPLPSSPSSPAATLKASIAAARREIEEKKEGQKTKQKDQRLANVSVRKEIEALSSRINKLGGEEKTHQSRQTQWQHNARQAEESIASITEQIESLDSVPEDDTQRWKQTREAYEALKTQQRSARQHFSQEQARIQQEKKAVEIDAANAHQKREKLQNRGVKLADQRERLQSATQKGLSEKDRREAERLGQDVEQQQVDQQLDQQHAQLARRMADLQQAVHSAHQQSASIESTLHHQHVPGAVSETHGQGPYEPSVPPGAYQSQAQGFRFPGGPFAAPESPHLRSKAGSLRQNVRTRSGSVTSNYSAYADFYDQDPAPPLPQNRAWDRTVGRQQSTGSGSGSGSGSARGPPSPAVSNGARVSPIGQRGSPKWK